MLSGQSIHTLYIMLHDVGDESGCGVAGSQSIGITRCYDPFWDDAAECLMSCLVSEGGV